MCLGTTSTDMSRKALAPVPLLATDDVVAQDLGLTHGEIRKGSISCFGRGGGCPQARRRATGR